MESPWDSDAKGNQTDLNWTEILELSGCLCEDMSTDNPQNASVGLFDGCDIVGDGVGAASALGVAAQTTGSPNVGVAQQLSSRAIVYLAPGTVATAEASIGFAGTLTPVPVPQPGTAPRDTSYILRQQYAPQQQQQCPQQQQEREYVRQQQPLLPLQQYHPPQLATQVLPSIGTQQFMSAPIDPNLYYCAVGAPGSVAAGLGVPGSAVLPAVMANASGISPLALNSSLQQLQGLQPQAQALQTILLQLGHGPRDAALGAGNRATRDPSLPLPLAVQLGLKPEADKQQPKDRVEAIGRLLEAYEQGGSGAPTGLQAEFCENPQPDQQYAFLACGTISKERTDMSAKKSGRIPVPLGNGRYVIGYSGMRCTCGITNCKNCEEQNHAYDPVSKYLLAFEDKPEGIESDVCDFKGPVKEGKKTSTTLWVPKEPRAVLWHLKPRIQDRASRSRPRQDRAQGSPPIAIPAAAEAAASEALLGLIEDPRAAAAHPKRARTTRRAPSPAAFTSAAATAALAAPDQATRQPELFASGQQQQRLLLLPDPAKPGQAEVSEPWLPSLQRMVDHLEGCGSLASFRALLSDLPLEHLLQMRIPQDGQCLAHLLVTPPSQLALVLGRGDDSAAPPRDPDEGMREEEAVEMIQMFISHLQRCCGTEAGMLEWRRLLQVQDSRHKANAVHRAGRFGHRLRVLEECVLPYASRTALLQVTGHLYTPFHSAFRSEREDAGGLLLCEAVSILHEMARSPDFAGWSCNAGLSLSPHSAPGLLGLAVYTLKNKYFRGENTQGYQSPKGRSGNDLLSARCAAVRAEVGTYGGPGAAEVAVTGSLGPELAFPSPEPRDKKHKLVDLAHLSNVTVMLDCTQPRPLPPAAAASRSGRSAGSVAHA